MVMSQSIQFASCVIAVCTVLVSFAAAQESDAVFPSIYPVNDLTCPNTLLRGCCPIYCPKPMPCIEAFCRGCRKDDYCSKPCSCIPCYCRTGTSYCYCGKPCPDLCRPIAADYFQCVKRCAGCADAHASGPNAQFPATGPQTGDGTSARIDGLSVPTLLDHSN
jgi:hypothetical protein